MEQLHLPDIVPPPARNGKATKELDAPRRPFTYEGDGPNAWSPAIAWSYNLMGMLGMGAQEFTEVSAGAALQQGAVMACLDIMAQDIARAPLTLNRLVTDGRRRRGYEVIGPRQHPLARLFWLRPNEFMTWHEFTTMIVFHLGLVNNAYILPRKNRLGEVIELIPIMPSRVTQDVDSKNGRIFYRVRAANAAEEVMLGGDDEIILFREELIHIKTRVLNGFVGTSTLAVGNRILAVTDAVTRFQDRLFRRDGMMRGVFEQNPQSTTQLSQEQYDRLRNSLKEAVGHLRDLGYPLVLEGGMTFRPISMTAAEAGIKETWEQQISETARLFRIPPHKLMHFNGVKYENMESMERLYVTDSLEPRCKPIEEQLTRWLLTNDEQMELYIEFDRKELHRQDAKSLNERILRQWDAGLITQNEAREELGHNPAKDGEIYKMAANTFLVDEDHAVVVTNQPSPGDPGSQGEGDDTGAPTNDTGEEPAGDEEGSNDD